MPELRVERPRDVRAFLDRAGSFLEAREAEHSLIFALCSGLTTNPEVFGEPPRFTVVADARGEVVGAAIQTPPRQLILSEATSPDVTSALVEALAATELPGVLGPKLAAAEFARRWGAARPGRSVEPGMRERIYRLSRVVPPRPAPGIARIAEARNRDQLAAWLRAFSLEALGEPMDEAQVFADRWIARLGGRAAWLWEVDGQVVSLSGVSGPTPHGIRVAPVYTPPELRGRGYAGNVVAAATQAQLDAGRRFVFLFTDLANPTSNHVYQAIGYEPVTDVDQWVFKTAAARG
jgi:predicted GNAT family acetyltransferase